MSTDQPVSQDVRFSLRRVMLILIPVVIAAAAVGWYASDLTSKARIGEEEWTANQIGLNSPTKNRLLDKFVDTDGDLLADRPAETECVTPETLYFSYIPGNGPGQQSDAWQGLMDAISQKTNVPVEFKPVSNVDDQLRAIAAGELHITGINTGLVPKAVNTTGFIPRFVLGNADGPLGYTMQFIVPQDSPLKSIDELQEKQITFTSTNSNSGFKAPVVMLMYDHGMKPGRDYEYGFSTSHDESIRLIAEGKVAVATVASDMIDRAVAAGTIQEDAVRSIYASERFPTAALGIAHNLAAELSDSIAAAISEYAVSGSPLEAALGLPADAKFVPVSYKDAWAIVRRTDDALGVIHAPIVPAKQNASAE